MKISSVVLLTIAALISVVEAAKFCYSGQNSRYAEKMCSTGGVDIDFTCQKFTCEGGKSPFVLRTCARKSMGCLAGPRICKFSGGTGSCSRCDNDRCNA